MMLFFPHFNLQKSSGIKGITMNKTVNGKAPTYNLSGQKLATPQKGINIIEGKKVVVK